MFELSQMKIFKTSGKHNTEEVFDCVLNNINDTQVKKIIISTTTGYTYLEFKKFIDKYGIKDLEIIVCCQDLNEEFSMNKKNREIILKDKIKLVDIPKRYLKTKLGFNAVNAIKYISEGAKVCIEMPEYLSEKGLLDKGDIFISIAGTLRGADTSMVLQYLGYSKYKLKQLLCFPG